MSEERQPKTDWFAELRRRRLFRAMAAYFVGAWVLLQIANVTFPPLGLPDWWQRALIIALVVGAVPVFVLAWIYDVTAHGVVRTPPASTAIVSVPRGGWKTSKPWSLTCRRAAWTDDAARRLRLTRMCRQARMIWARMLNELDCPLS